MFDCMALLLIIGNVKCQTLVILLTKKGRSVYSQKKKWIKIPQYGVYIIQLKNTIESVRKIPGP